MAKRILIIEDDADMRTAMTRMLLRAGYQAEASPYLATTIGKALSVHYDLITLDLNMPGIDGGEVAELFQFREVKTPVIVISAYLDEATLEHLREAGVQHFLEKPFEASALLKVIGDAILP